MTERKWELERKKHQVKESEIEREKINWEFNTREEERELDGMRIREKNNVIKS